jgi:hypothetical protein
MSKLHLNNIVTPEEFSAAAQSSKRAEGPLATSPAFMEWRDALFSISLAVAHETGDDPATIHAASCATLATIEKALEIKFEAQSKTEKAVASEAH